MLFFLLSLGLSLTLLVILSEVTALTHATRVVRLPCVLTCVGHFRFAATVVAFVTHIPGVHLPISVWALRLLPKLRNLVRCFSVHRFNAVILLNQLEGFCQLSFHLLLLSKHFHDAFKLLFDLWVKSWWLRLRLLLLVSCCHEDCSKDFLFLRVYFFLGNLLLQIAQLHYLLVQLATFALLILVLGSLGRNAFEDSQELDDFLSS